jgi:hypothetical protein
MSSNAGPAPDVGGVVVLAPGDEGGTGEGAGLIGRHAPAAGVALRCAPQQLKMQVAAAAIQLPHLHPIYNSYCSSYTIECNEAPINSDIALLHSTNLHRYTTDIAMTIPGNEMLSQL